MRHLRLGIFVTFALFFSGVTASSHVALDYPIGGATFDEGDTVNVQWHIVIPHDLQNWDLYFSDDGGSTWQPIELDLPPAQLSYDWIVPGIATEQGRVRIYMDNSGTDYEDQSEDFTVMALTIPTLSEWGMIILGLSLLALGTIAIVRRKEQSRKQIA
jgi:hypothetical protein